jgi:7,8-dihydroneopterin aldolase/epimerase/oxygenase
MGFIEIEGMHFYAYHGYFEVEQVVGSEFSVDVYIETDCSRAAASDKLEDALNYQAVFDVVKREMQVKSHLLEHVAKRILDALFVEFQFTEKIKVKVSKLNPPMGGQIDRASVTLIQ